MSAHKHKAVRPVRLEPATPGSRVTHSTTEPLCSQVFPGCPMQKVSKFDQEIPQSHTTDQPTAPQGRVKEQ